MLRQISYIWPIHFILLRQTNNSFLYFLLCSPVTQKRIALLNSITEANCSGLCNEDLSCDVEGCNFTFVPLRRIQLFADNIVLISRHQFILSYQLSFVSSPYKHSSKIIIYPLTFSPCQFKNLLQLPFFLRVVLKIHLNVFLAAYGSSLYSTLPRDGQKPSVLS